MTTEEAGGWTRRGSIELGGWVVNDVALPSSSSRSVEDFLGGGGSTRRAVRRSSRNRSAGRPSLVTCRTEEERYQGIDASGGELQREVLRSSVGSQRARREQNPARVGNGPTNIHTHDHAAVRRAQASQGVFEAPPLVRRGRIAVVVLNDHRRGGRSNLTWTFLLAAEEWVEDLVSFHEPRFMQASYPVSWLKVSQRPLAWIQGEVSAATCSSRHIAWRGPSFRRNRVSVKPRIQR